MDSLILLQSKHPRSRLTSSRDFFTASSPECTVLLQLLKFLANSRITPHIHLCKHR